MKSTLKNPYVYAMFVLPTLLLYCLFFIYPMASSSFYAFTDWNGLEDYSFIGFDNFTTAFNDPDFRNAIVNNMYFILFSVFIQVPLIIFFAILIGQIKRFQGFYKTTVFIPSILSTSVIGILWGFIYEPEIGPLNKLLSVFGIDPIYWLADTKWAMVSVLAANAWQWMGFYIVLVLAAILAIPREVNEAAEIDGASGRQRALLITVPLIRPIISVVIMLSIAGAMRVVDIILVMTKGGPVGSTEVMASYLVNEAMGVDPNYGFGTAISLIIFAFALVLTALYQLTFGRNQGGND
ncbi:carbohydrate ABC transporter membrane protein 1 (CUT1 family) [Paenibacillus cellulosilyticus]|uniref:Carbohydrate ABC transporter membrane protein 1 (CUT1 family) n=1 Tax=Paenibacillus cellulosilyticus TaxID=375489 RepID=A0A2V2YQ90_9BACL|nr:sugar ABC transporter permease [Paenibacillus cellulosilyticus]PWV98702.1 carbohydrate ABC transporter membrane protein 1 (CUT1 family) [Paenibacillus cellulosilyticus]QKS43797.1 sugar ABC transporter permease [Paenibacillus cellulosilyticus]